MRRKSFFYLQIVFINQFSCFTLCFNEKKTIFYLIWELVRQIRRKRLWCARLVILSWSLYAYEITYTPQSCLLVFTYMPCPKNPQSHHTHQTEIKMNNSYCQCLIGISGLFPEKAILQDKVSNVPLGTQRCMEHILPISNIYNL